MVPLSANAKLVLGGVLIVLITLGHYLVNAGVTWMWLSPILTALIYIDGLFTTPPKAQRAINELQAQKVALTARVGGANMMGLAFASLAAARMLASLAGLAVACLLAVSLSGCPQGAAAVGPGLSCVSAVVADALSGMTLEQILDKEKGPCVKDLSEVIAILVGAEAQTPAVRQTIAYRAALAIRAAQHPASDAGAP